MKFFKRTSDNTTLSDSIAIQKTKLSDQLEEQVESVTATYDTNALIVKVYEKLEMEKYKYPDQNTYKYELLKKIIFYKEMMRKISYIMAVIIRGHHDGEPQDLVSDAKKEINLQIEELIAKHYDYFFSKYLAVDEGIAGMEREYKEQLMKYVWFKDMLEQFSVNPPVIPADIPVRWAVRRIEEICDQKVSETLYLY